MSSTTLGSLWRNKELTSCFKRKGKRKDKRMNNVDKLQWFLFKRKSIRYCRLMTIKLMMEKPLMMIKMKERLTNC